MKKETIKIYTDGAARGNPGPAGWGVVIINEGSEIDEGKITEIGGRLDHATNNQMELTAPIEALKYMKQRSSLAQGVEIISDSKYVILGITEWIKNWQKNNWRNAAKKPVLNRELWEELYKLTGEFKPQWTYVKGHSGDKYNDRVDEIATSFADDNPVPLKK